MKNKKKATFQDIYRNVELQPSRREVNQFDAVQNGEYGLKWVLDWNHSVGNLT